MPRLALPAMPLATKTAGFAAVVVLFAGSQTLAGPHAQADTGSKGPAFEVASVKPSMLDTWLGGDGGGPSGDRWRSQHATLEAVIRTAYQLRPNFVIGGPDWIRRERFVIDAKAEGRPTPDQFRTMVQHLLEDRFALRAHMEDRPVEIFALVKARADGRLGPGLRASAVDCDALRARTGLRGPIAVGPSGRRQACESDSGMSAGNVTRLSETWKIEQLTRALQSWMGRPVIDRTGLDGFYDFDLTFDFATLNAPDPVAGVAASVYVALQEQLGLKLESRRERMPVLVVDHAERPTPD